METRSVKKHRVSSDPSQEKSLHSPQQKSSGDDASPVNAGDSNDTRSAPPQEKSSDPPQELHAQSTNTVKCNFGIRPNPVAQAGIDYFASANNASLVKNPRGKTNEITQEYEGNDSESEDDESKSQKDQDKGDDEYFTLCQELLDEVCKKCRNDSTYNRHSEETVPLLKQFIELSSKRFIRICKDEGMSDDVAKRVFKKLVGTSANKSNLNV